MSNQSIPPDGDASNERVQLTTEQTELLDRLARGQGMSRADYLRRLEAQMEFGQLESVDIEPGVNNRKRERDQLRETFSRRGKRERVTEPLRAEEVPPDWRDAAMIHWLARFVRTGLEALDAKSAPQEFLDTVQAAFAAVYGDGESVEFMWAQYLILTLDALVLQAPGERAPALRLEPDELIQNAIGEEWQLPVPPPGYLTRPVVQWALRHYTPNEAAGGGRLTAMGMAKLITHPEALCEVLDTANGDKAAARGVRDWIDSHAGEAPFGFYWGQSPDRLPKRPLPRRETAERRWLKQ